MVQQILVRHSSCHMQMLSSMRRTLLKPPLPFAHCIHSKQTKGDFWVVVCRSRMPEQPCCAIRPGLKTQQDCACDAVSKQGISGECKTGRKPHHSEPLLPPDASTPSSLTAMLSMIVDWFWSMLCRNLPSGKPNLRQCTSYAQQLAHFWSGGMRCNVCNATQETAHATNPKLISSTPPESDPVSDSESNLGLKALTTSWYLQKHAVQRHMTVRTTSSCAAVLRQTREVVGVALFDVVGASGGKRVLGGVQGHGTHALLVVRQRGHG